jgi:hypothetical protein
MPLLNYTTEVPAQKSIMEITTILQDGGANAIMLEYEPDRSVRAISFRMETSFGPVPYCLPANVGSVITALNAQIQEETKAVNRRSNYKRKIPRNLYNNKEQAARIAWRIAKDWLEAQLALTTIGSAKFEQIMMPFAQLKDGRSFYDHVVDRGGALALEAAPKEERAAIPV